jgi:hypothetical protein
VVLEQQGRLGTKEKLVLLGLLVLRAIRAQLVLQVAKVKRVQRVIKEAQDQLARKGTLDLQACKVA